MIYVPAIPEKNLKNVTGLKKMDNLQKLLSFIKLTQDFRNIERQVIFKKTNQRENDIEHSYQLAMAAWYLADSRKLDLNINLLLKYALVHDLVEIYAGDTPMHSKDEVYVQSKEQREKLAREKLKSEIVEFYEVHALIEAYEEKKDKESKFIYALDKLLPPLNIYLEGGHSWKVNNISLDMIIKSKSDKIALSPDVKVYFDELVEILEKNKDNLFTA